MTETKKQLIWDFDGTLGHRPQGWSGALCEAVAAECPEVAITRESLLPHLQEGFPWHAPELTREPGDADAWWDALFPTLARAIHLSTELRLEEAMRAARRARGFFTNPRKWRLYEDSLPALERLSALGWTHSLLSNHVPELTDLLQELGVMEHLSAVYCSAELGVEKPNALAFEAVLRDHPEARDGWFIGDSWRADVEGASAVGMRAILVRSNHPQTEWQCETLHDLIDFLDES